MNKNIMETSMLDCYVFLIVKRFGRVQDRLVNAISEITQRQMEEFFDKLGNWIDCIIKHGNCVGT